MKSAIVTLLRVVGIVLLTFWWLPIAFVLSLALIANSTPTAVAVSICVGLLALASVPQLWATKTASKRQFLRAVRWLLLSLPVLCVAVVAIRYPNGAAGLHPAVWLQLVIAGAALTLPACVAALICIAPVAGLRTVSQVWYVVGAALVGYGATAYGTLLGKIEIAENGFHIDSIDAVATAMWFSPAAALLVGFTMMAVVRRETLAPSR